MSVTLNFNVLPNNELKEDYKKKIKKDSINLQELSKHLNIKAAKYKIDDKFDNNRDYQFAQPDYKRNTKKYARLVAKVKNGSKSWIFTLADVSDSFIKSVKDGVNEIPINKSGIVLGNFSFLNKNLRHEPLSNTIDLHPSIHTSGVYYERQGKRKGNTFVYISSIPFSTDAEC